ncbi:VWA domain-containing protein [Gemmata sp.]|uniref:VWA domain-containing protein n=1 Tax=Gemmata sp. TaxID=1914242 RepID=UPI003F6EB70D
MAQLTQPVEPFGEVNVYRRPDGALEVVATILMEPDIEGARTGLALDGSASMQKMYGANAVVSPLFRKASAANNVVEPVARMMAGHLARFAGDGRAHVIYWACSPDGSAIEPLGACSAAGADALPVRGPKQWGRQTKLLPPVRYFVDQVFREARWAIAVFVTDGVVEDLDEVKAYCLEFARKVARGERNFVKLVLLGVGEEVDEGQMEELDDMFEGSDLRDPKGGPIDLWDHKLASEMRSLNEIFAEVVDDQVTVTDWGKVLDPSGRVVRDYADGLPARIRFRLPAGSAAFTLAFPDGRVTQDLTEALDRL